MSADAAFWNQIAPTYAAKPVDDPGAFDRKIAITAALIRPRDVVVDVGCGTGSLALRLAPHAAEVHGLDVSNEMIRIATAKAAGTANVRFHVGAIADGLPFAPGSVDGLCAYSLLHLVDDQAATLASLYRVLRPGGFFVSSTVCLGGSWLPYAPMLAVMRWAGKAPRVALLTQQALTQAIVDAGFVDVQAPEVGAKSTIAFLVAKKPT